MNSAMDFSIITPCFNSIRWIGQCIASVRGQVAPEAQKSDDLISDLRSPISESGASLRVHHHIQDGGSTDGTRGFLEKLAAVDGSSLVVDGGSETLDNEHSATYQLTFASEADKGMYNALNKAFEKVAPNNQSPIANNSRDSVIGHLNADEQYLPGTLRFVADFFEKHPKVDVLFGAVVVTDAEGNYICSRMPLKPQLWHTQVCHLATFTASMFFRRSAIEKLDCYFDESFKIAGDADLVCRMLKARLKMATVRRYFSIFVDSGDNLGIKKEGLLRNKSPCILKKMSGILTLFHRIRKILRGSYILPPFSYTFVTRDLTVVRFKVRKTVGKWFNR
jgi:glycosyltransferase involved in cell wall biosynthesis